MPFIWDWIWRKLSGTSETATQPQSVGRPKVDNQVREEVVRNGREIPTKTGNTSSKPPRVRSNNTGKAGGKGARKTVRSPASKSKSKSKTV